MVVILVPEWGRSSATNVAWVTSVEIVWMNLCMFWHVRHMFEWTWYMFSHVWHVELFVWYNCTKLLEYMFSYCLYLFFPKVSLCVFCLWVIVVFFFLTVCIWSYFDKEILPWSLALNCIPSALKFIRRLYGHHW